ncbi:MAG: hypothetical protein KIS76_13625 [Pyrinomonadaceae bacterium]|nr:hypothetical protein [Pyrinomonadaceae bacterium]
MSKIFNCPACGKPMEYDGKTTLFQTCGSCNAPIVVPMEVVDQNRIFNDESQTGVPAVQSAPVFEAGSIHDPKVIANARIFEAVNSGNKIEAIKLHREAFSTDLESSKEAIETLERDIARSKSAVKDVPPKTKISNSQFDEFARLLGKGQKVEAIKLFRERFGTSLNDAKEAVEAIERSETP